MAQTKPTTKKKTGSMVSTLPVRPPRVPGAVVGAPASDRVPSLPDHTARGISPPSLASQTPTKTTTQARGKGTGTSKAAPCPIPPLGEPPGKGSPADVVLARDRQTQTLLLRQERELGGNMQAAPRANSAGQAPWYPMTDQL